MSVRLNNEEAFIVPNTQPRITNEYCMQFIGKKVVAYHVSGEVYRGRLHSVSNEGIYLMRARLIYPAAASTTDLSADYAISNAEENSDISEAFFPFLFLPLVALTGLAAARPYPYPYGYYPGPWY